MIASGVSTASSAAVVHDGDPLREPGDDLHVVLDHQHRLALVACTERISSTSSGTSSTETPAIGSSSRITRGVAGEQHRELELALVAVRERAGGHAPRGRRARRGRAPSCARSTASRDARSRAARSASSRRAPPPPRAGRSRAPAAAGTRSTPGTSARCPARVRRNGGCRVMSTPSSSMRAGSSAGAGRRRG